MFLGTRGLCAALMALSVFSARPASALVELRANYGLQTVDPDLASSFPAFSQLTGVGADVIISPPLIPLGVGLRYEMLGADLENGFSEIDINIDRLSALATFRIIDLVLYLGAIGTVGLNHSGSQKITTKSPAATVLNEDVDIDFSYSLGLEGGLKLAGLLLGAEAGYMGMTLQNKAAGVSNLDFTGPYLKAHIGFGF